MGGLLAGLLGIGGGIIYVFIFSFFLPGFANGPIDGHHLVSLLIANTVFALVFAGIAGSIKQYLAGNFFPKTILWIGIPGVVTSIITSMLISWSDIYSKEAFAILFAVIMIPVILRMLKPNQITAAKRWAKHPKNFALTGAIAGTVTALSGLGGGFIIVPVLNGLMGIPIKKTISISLGTIALVAFFFTFYNLFGIYYPQYNFPYSQGSIIFPMVVPAVAGVLLGAPQGVRLSHKLPNKWLRVTFVTFTIIVIIHLFIKFFN